MNNLEYILIITVIGLIGSLNPLLISVYSKKVSADKGLHLKNSAFIFNNLTFFIGFIISIIVTSKVLFSLLNSVESYNFYFYTILIAVLSILFGSLKIIAYILKKSFYPIPGQVESLVHTLCFKKNNNFTSFLLGLIMVFLLATSLGILIFLLVALLIINNQPLYLSWSILLALASLFTAFGLFIYAFKSKRVALIVKWNEDNRYILRLYSGLAQIILAWVVLVQIIGENV